MQYDEEPLDRTELLQMVEADNKSTSNFINSDMRALPSGTVLNEQYRIDAVIGEGGFGITYIGYDTFLKIKVAIKECFPAQFATRNAANGKTELSIIGGERTEQFKKFLKDFEYEANRLTRYANLSGIVSVYNFFYANNTAYMVMEYVEGITLKEYLQQNGGRVSCQVTLDMMQSVISSLDIIHGSGLIHRDISPDNILISAENAATIIDFGAARSYDDQKSRTIILKHGYAPPEQYFSNGKQGPWSDVYALCATIYRMITGIRLPDAMAIWNKSVSVVPVDKCVEGVPSNISNAIMKGIQPVIDKRISSMKELEQYFYKKVRVRKTINQFVPYIVGGVTMATLLSGAIIAYSIMIKDSKSGEQNIASNSSERLEMSATVVDNVIPNNMDNTTYNNELMEDEKEEILPTVFANVSIPSIEIIDCSEVNGGVQIDRINGTTTEIEIPEMINGMNVVALNGVGSDVVNIVLNKGMEIIKEDAFRNCIYLENVYIPATITTIENGAFANCMSLQSIVVSDNNDKFYVDDRTLYDENQDIIVSW